MFRLTLAASLIFTCLAALPEVAKQSSDVTYPEAVRSEVDVPDVVPSGRAIAVAARGDFQAALAKAQPGDVITLEAGATFKGPFVLPSKQGSGWITIRTSTPDNAFPSRGTRIQPSVANLMPKLEAAFGSVVATAPGAHHYRFIGIEIRPKTGVFLHELVRLGRAETSVDRVPHHVVFERCYFHGDPRQGTRRGIAMNSRETAVIDSYFSDFKEAGADSQAIAGWTGPGPFKIINNYLEGAGENVMFGGADPSIENLVPSDIEIARNHFYKPLSWKADDPSYAGIPWTVKNLFELKNARRVRVEGNLFEHNWPQAQSGFAILFTVRNQDGSAPWSVVEDVSFINNLVRHATSGINILGQDDIHSSQQARRILIKNNLFDDIGGPLWGGGGRLFQLLRGAADVVIEQNTAFQTENIITAEGVAHTGFIYRCNITPHNTYGVIGTGTSVGNPTLRKYFPGAEFEGNVIVGGRSAQYPPDNFFPASLDDVGFLGRRSGDYRLSDSSQFKGTGRDGKDLGVDLDALCAAMAGTCKKGAPALNPNSTNSRQPHKSKRVP